MVMMKVTRGGALHPADTSDGRTVHVVRAVERTRRSNRGHPRPEMRDVDPPPEMRDVVGGVEEVGEVVEVEGLLEEEDQDLKTVEITIETRSQKVKAGQHVGQTRVSLRVRLASN